MPLPNFFRAAAYVASNVTQTNGSELLNNATSAISNTSASVLHNITQITFGYLNNNTNSTNSDGTNYETVGAIGALVLAIAAGCCLYKCCKNDEVVVRQTEYRFQRS
jgi:hypothetical protein